MPVSQILNPGPLRYSQWTASIGRGEIVLRTLCDHGIGTLIVRTTLRTLSGASNLWELGYTITWTRDHSKKRNSTAPCQKWPAAKGRRDRLRGRGRERLRHDITTYCT